jgi:hypothetical protein
MSTKNKRERNNQEKKIKLNFDTNTDINNNEDPQMTTTISSYNNFRSNRTDNFKTDKKQFHISFNRTLKSQILKEKTKNFAKTKNKS